MTTVWRQGHGVYRRFSGHLIPPLHHVECNGLLCGGLVGKLFFAALIPGLLLAACYAIYIIIICHIHPEYGPAMMRKELAEMPLEAARC